MNDQQGSREINLEPRPAPTQRYEKPTVQVISLACEISAYAPDDDDTPLF